jgi:signal transduction histidine kinase
MDCADLQAKIALLEQRTERERQARKLAENLLEQKSLELYVANEELARANRAVMAVNEELERRVEARTAELRVAQDELLKRERLSILGQLTATVAHELRNPMSAIKNTLFSIKEIVAARGVNLERPLGRMERSIERCNRIIADLLDYTKTRELRRSLQPLDAWLDETLAEQRLPDAVVLHRALASGDGLVSLDVDRFRQVVVNLVDNAAQAMTDPAGGAGAAEKRISIRTRTVDGRIELVVEDTGPGIRPENLPKVFEPLFSTKSFGTGLGLPTVKQIVEQHGGTIAIESELGVGTRVVILLPPAPAESERAAA